MATDPEDMKARDNIREQTQDNVEYADEPFPLRKDTMLHDVMVEAKEQAEKIRNCLLKGEETIEFRGFTLLFTTSNNELLEKTVSDKDFNMDDYE